MNPEEQIKPVEVFAGELIQVTFIKDLLEQNGIRVFLGNQNMSFIAPWYVSAGGANALKVIVSSRDAERALELIGSQDTDEK